MKETTKYAKLPGRLVIIGCGSISQGVIPLLFRHLVLSPQNVTIITADEAGRHVAEEFGAKFVQNPLTKDNYRRILEPLVGKNSFLLNLSRQCFQPCFNLFLPRTRSPLLGLLH